MNDHEDMIVKVTNEQEFWNELDALVSSDSITTHGQIDDVLRSYLDFAAQYRQEYLFSEYDVARYCYKLLDATVFQRHQQYVRRQMLFCLLQEDEVALVHLSAAVLLYDGRSSEATFEMMQDEAVFPRLVDLIRVRSDDEPGLHRLLLELMYEMSRVQKLTRDDLSFVDDAFILYLLQLVENLSEDVDDPYHYPIIRVLLVLNEQYMCFSNAPPSPSNSNGKSGPVANRIIKLLSLHGPSYRTFGENIILLLNRESALSPQLLILKLLYLLFTTPSTYEYFYTNDLYVLVDVIIRNLLDLDHGDNDLTMTSDGSEKDGQRALRHTYLRVLCPLLKNTQIAREGSYYKREEVRKLLYLLVDRSSAHFAPVDETVLRLVLRCRQIDWLREEGDELDQEIERKLNTAMPAPDQSHLAKKLLGMSLNQDSGSSLSVDEAAAKVTKEKPSLPAPRRRRPTVKAPLAKKSWGAMSTANLLSAPLPPLPVPQHADRKASRSPFVDEGEDA